MASAVVGDQLAYVGRAVQTLWILLFLGAVGIDDIDCPNKDKSALTPVTRKRAIPENKRCGVESVSGDGPLIDNGTASVV